MDWYLAAGLFHGVPGGIKVVTTFFLFSFMVSKTMFWNRRGVRSQRFCDTLNDLIRIHKVDLAFIVEPRISRTKADEMVKTLNL